MWEYFRCSQTSGPGPPEECPELRVDTQLHHYSPTRNHLGSLCQHCLLTNGSHSSQGHLILSRDLSTPSSQSIQNPLYFEKSNLALVGPNLHSRTILQKQISFTCMKAPRTEWVPHLDDYRPTLIEVTILC